MSQSQEKYEQDPDLEKRIEAHALAIGNLIEAEGEVGIVLTWHAGPDLGDAGTMNLMGTGVDATMLRTLLARAYEHGVRHGSTL